MRAERFKADGDTFEGQHDAVRLGTLLEAVFELMKDGRWRTLGEIHQALRRGSEASISARLRDLRKPEHGRYHVPRQRRGEPSDGLWEYRVGARLPVEQLGLFNDEEGADHG